MRSVEKNTSEGTPENSLSTCEMRQDSACSASLGKAEVRDLLGGDLCCQTQVDVSKNQTSPTETKAYPPPSPN